MSTAASFAAQDLTEPAPLALWRLYLLRGGYLLIAVGMGMQIGTAYLGPHAPWTLTHGVMNAMLLALVLLSVLGLRYPLKMLPLLFWEMGWKAIWLLSVALPAWQSGKVDAGIADTAFACSISAIFLFVVPWSYVFAHYVRLPGDRWK